MRHLDNLVLKNGLMAGALCATLVFALGWSALVIYPLHHARLRADTSVDHAVTLLNVEFDRAERTAQGLRALWPRRQEDLKDPSRIALIRPFLDHDGLVRNLILARADGETVFMFNADRTWRLLMIPPGPRHSAVLYDVDGRWVPAEPAPNERDYQAKDRPWFHLAQASEGPAWTEPYRFTAGSAGFTHVVPVRDQDRLVGVVGVDFTAANLERRLADLLPPWEFHTLLTDSAGRMVSGTQPLAPVEPGRLAKFEPGGVFTYRRGVVLRGQAPALTLWVAMEPSALVPWLRLRVAIVVLVSLASFAAVMIYVYYLNRNLVRPIMRLLGGAGDEPSQIWEFRQLEDSIRRLGQTETDRQQILQQLEHAQRVETMGTMAPGVIHDLNNHLSVILAQLGLCLEEAGTNPSLHKRIGKAERATLRCAQAMRGLLEYSRPGASQPVEFHLNDLVLTTGALLEPVLGESITLRTELAEDNLSISGEPVKLQQVLVNLALNARDAMRGCGELTFRTWLEAGQACLEVADTGCGMTDEVKKKLFDPFFTTKEPGKGTGLGMTMVQRILSAHGGSIDVDSAPGAGTRFTLRLPCVELEFA